MAAGSSPATRASFQESDMLKLAIGVVLGTFIPMPQQQIVRAAVKSTWNRICVTLSERLGIELSRPIR
jgi:hypothetical protein